MRLAEGVEVPQTSENRDLERQPATTAAIGTKGQFGRSANRNQAERRAENESTAASAKARGADRKATTKKLSRRLGQYHSPESLLKEYPAAHCLSVYDGRRRTGLILDPNTYRPGRRLKVRLPSYAYDGEGRFLGEFPTRKVAGDAVSARDKFEVTAS